MSQGLFCAATHLYDALPPYHSRAPPLLRKNATGHMERLPWCRRHMDGIGRPGDMTRKTPFFIITASLLVATLALALPDLELVTAAAAEREP